MSKEKELLDLYDALSQVDNNLLDLIRSLECDIPLGQEFDLNNVDTYFELFECSRSVFKILSTSIHNCNYVLQNFRRNSSCLEDAQRAKIKSSLLSVIEIGRQETLEEIDINQKILPNPIKTTHQEFRIFRDLILGTIASFLMFYGAIKIFDDLQIINHFCRTFEEKQEE